ncbi:hypothetical protein BX666DRAFT_2008107 [Dichotomocladium elegans]|nr:hypothetical protein BX666DRAFT_2008107 [Dichotomocladium elegans]
MAQQRKTRYWQTRSERLQALANRFIYSRSYILLYLTLAFLSLISIAVSLQEKCPTPLFVSLEFVINIATIIEVAVRLIALKKAYWKSVWNQLDVALVILCTITLVWLAISNCSAGEQNEALFDTILLVVRNGFQLFRLLTMARKNKHTLLTRTSIVDFTAVREDDNNLLRRLEDQDEEQRFWHDYENII